MKFFVLLFALSSSSLAHARVEIASYKKTSWNNAWNESISNELDKNESVMMTESIDTKDLLELDCLGFNNADNDSKKDFWIVFLSSLTRAESAFDVKARSKAPKGGHGNYGLLQFSQRTAREQCGLSKEDIADPNAHLRCGIKLLSWQLEGAPNKNGKQLRPDLKGQLFGKNILLWGPLRQNDFRGRKLLVGWFKKHLDQMPFCKI